MSPDPTITISLDYLIEFGDDGKQPDQPETEVVVIPPTPPLPAPANAPEAGSQQ